MNTELRIRRPRPEAPAEFGSRSIEASHRRLYKHFPERRYALIKMGLLKGFDCAREKMIPGNTMHDVYVAANTAIRDSGLPNYSRGHFGHSLGMDELIEEPPFIGDNQTVIRPGMVLCLEKPYYPPDV